MNNSVDLVKRIETIEKEIKRGETLEIQADTRVKTLREQYKRVEESLKSLGVEPKRAKEELDEIDKAIEEKLKAIEQLIPSDIIEKYQNFDFSQANSSDEEPDLGIDF